MAVLYDIYAIVLKGILVLKLRKLKMGRNAFINSTLSLFHHARQDLSTIRSFV
jgi:hypothetical protein